MNDHEQVLAAIRGGDAARLRELVREEPSRARTRDSAGLSAVLLACYQRRRDLVEILLSAGAELDLFEAAAAGRADRARELLAREPGAARAFSPDGFTPLHYAAFFGFAEIAELLLQAGAEVNAVSRNAMGVEPLHSAAAAGQRGIVKLLLERGASVNARQAGGYTPLHSAANLGDLEMARLLLDHGADPAARNEDGQTPFNLAQARGFAPVAELLRPRD